MSKMYFQRQLMTNAIYNYYTYETSFRNLKHCTQRTSIQTCSGIGCDLQLNYLSVSISRRAAYTVLVIIKLTLFAVALRMRCGSCILIF